MALPIDATISIRPAIAADFDAVASIWLTSWQSTGVVLSEEPTLMGLRHRVDVEIIEGWALTVAEHQGKVVGFVASKPDAALLDQLFIHIDYQRMGVGSALLAEAQKTMPSGFTLRAATANVGARAFYEKHGLHVVGEGIHPRLGYPYQNYAWKSS
ncbi:GNAT family N-acetyltransferase [Sphingomonas oleivorans]|uniref:GNAT family N-acetyltransferase n=1 Tax=Sphingomonas oleivorans TaxID=1735121 RepID=A0A2T5FUQ1_9SPHN|nr:GNAT family N-acetyltransferase [Sphingomonas oleivorans]PTQ08259.1 GNAT family N-acetyltransferase [Sphingomonas oleivorans]